MSKEVGQTMVYGGGSCDENCSLVQKPEWERWRKQWGVAYLIVKSLNFVLFVLEGLDPLFLGLLRFRPENCKKFTMCPSRANSEDLYSFVFWVLHRNRWKEGFYAQMGCFLFRMGFESKKPCWCISCVPYWVPVFCMLVLLSAEQ